MGVRENAKGTVIAQRMDMPAHIFANAMQLVEYHGNDQDEDKEEEKDFDW